MQDDCKVQRVAKMTPETLQEVARQRFVRRLQWKDIAANLGVDYTTVWRWRQTTEWQQVCQQWLEALQTEGAPIALATLVEAARQGDVQAARHLWEAIKGIRSEVHAHVTYDVQVRALSQLSDEQLEEILALPEPKTNSDAEEEQ